MKGIVSTIVVLMMSLSVFYPLYSTSALLTESQQETGRSSGITNEVASSAMWIEPSTTILNVSEVDLGYRFNLTVWIDLVEASYTWQITLVFDSTYLNATRAGYTGGSQSMFFSGHSTIPVSPIFTSNTVMFGESLIGMDSKQPGNGSLCWIEFSLQSKTAANLTIAFQEADTYVLDPDLNLISIPDLRNAQIILVGATPPPSGDNIMWIDPSTLNFTTTTRHLHDRFNVTVWTSTSADTYTWEIGLRYDATQLNATRAGYTAGSTSMFFTGHTTIIVAPQFTENVVLLGESLLGIDARLPGNGSLCWIEFEIMAEPAPSSTLSSILDLNDPEVTFWLDAELNAIPLTTFNAYYSYTNVAPPPSGGNRMWIDPSTLDFYTDTTHLHDRFNVTVWTSTSVETFAWEISLVFSAAHLNATRVGYTGGSASMFFTGHTTIPVTPLFAGDTVVFGESLLGTDSRLPGNGSLCWIEFEIMAEPAPSSTLSSILNITNPDTFWLDPILNAVSLETVNAVYNYHSVEQGVHDIAIINVNAVPTEVVAGEIVNITVTVLNEGTFSEAFNVSCHYDSAVVGAVSVTLMPNETRQLFFAWNTFGVLPGTYTISAKASIVPGESHTADNTFTDGRVTITQQQPPKPFAVLVKFTPQTLNLDSKGKWITAHVKLIGQYSASDIEVSTIRLDSTILAWNAHGRNVLTVKFNRSEVIRDIRDIQGISNGYVTLNMTGRFVDGTPFLGSDTIRVRTSGDADFDGRVDMKDVGSVARRYGKNNFDTNEDNKIDMTDIAVYARGRSISLLTVAREFGTTTNLGSFDMNEDGIISMNDIAITVRNFRK